MQDRKGYSRVNRNYEGSLKTKYDDNIHNFEELRQNSTKIFKKLLYYTIELNISFWIYTIPYHIIHTISYNIYYTMPVFEMKIRASLTPEFILTINPLGASVALI